MRKRAICRRSRPFLSLKPFGPGGVRTSRGAVHVDAAARDLEPRAAAGRERVLYALAAIEDRGVDLRVLMDVQRALFAVRRDKQAELPALVGEELLLVARLDVFDRRQDPD